MIAVWAPNDVIFAVAQAWQKRTQFNHSNWKPVEGNPFVMHDEVWGYDCHIGFVLRPDGYGDRYFYRLHCQIIGQGKVHTIAARTVRGSPGAWWAIGQHDKVRGEMERKAEHCFGFTPVWDKGR